MKISIPLQYLVGVIALFLVSHFIARGFDLYRTAHLIDIPIHFLAGLMLGAIWLWVVDRGFWRMAFGEEQQATLALSTVGFALLGSFIWEIVEYVFFRFFPGVVESLAFYPNTVSDALSDMTAGVIGGVCVALWFIVRARS